MFDDLYADAARLNLEMAGGVDSEYVMGDALPINTITVLDLSTEIVDRYEGSIRTVDVLTFLTADVGRVRTGAVVVRKDGTFTVQAPLEDDGFVSRAVVTRG